MINNTTYLFYFKASEIKKTAQHSLHSYEIANGFEEGISKIKNSEISVHDIMYFI